MLQGAPSAVVHEVVDAHVQQLLSGRSLEAYVQAYGQAHASASLAAKAASAEAQALLQPLKKEAHLAAISSARLCKARFLHCGEQSACP